MTIRTLPSRRPGAVPTATAAQMAEADRIASDGLGIPLDTLMENASRQVAAAIRLFFDDLSGKDVVALAGKGNNGGDALGALPYLRDAGALIEAFTVGERDDVTVLAGIRHDALTRSGVTVSVSAGIDDRTIVRRLERADIVIDGLLGYGATRAARGEVARLILLATAAAAPPKTVAVDLPSGLHPDTGIRALDPQAGIVRAVLTVTLALPKPGLFVKDARAYVGELVVADIGIPPEAFARLGIETRGLFAKGPLLRIAF